MNSPYAQVAEELAVNDISAVPIKPGTKFPGTYDAGNWYPMRGWSRYNEDRPNPDLIRNWCTFPGAGVGVVLGKASRNLMAVDIDNATDAMDEVIKRILPGSDVAKVGAKGRTEFYQTDGSVPPQKIFAPIEEGGKPVAIIEFLGHGNQTVIPPTIHPETQRPYEWVNANCTLMNTPPQELPMLTGEHVQAVIDALAPFRATASGSAPEISDFPTRSSGDSGVGEDVYVACNRHALERLGEWVDELGLFNGQWEGGAYRAVPTWRASNSGRDPSVRKRNLSITRGGIRDFGTGKSYSPLDVVMAHKGLSFVEAWGWLAERVDPLLQWDVQPLIDEWNRKALNSVGFIDTENFVDLSEYDPGEALAQRIADDEAERAEARAIEVANEEAAQEDVAAEVQVKDDGGSDSADDELFRAERYLLQKCKEFGGVVGLMTQYLNAKVEEPSPFMEFLTALSYTSALVSRHWVLRGHHQTHANIYALVIAGAGYGKTTRMSAAEKLFRLADQRSGDFEFSYLNRANSVDEDGNRKKMTMRLCATNLIRGGRVTSGSALVRQLSEMPVMLSAVDEYGSELRKMFGKNNAGFQDDIRINFLDLFSKSVGEFRQTGKSGEMDSLPIDNPGFSLFGMTTQTDFMKHYTPDMFGTGFLPRFLSFMELRRASMHRIPSNIDPSPVVTAINHTLLARKTQAPMSDGNAAANVLPSFRYIDLTAQQKATLHRRAGEMKALSADMEVRGDIGSDTPMRIVELGCKISLIIRASTDPHATDMTDEILDFGFNIAKFLGFRLLSFFDGLSVPVSQRDDESRKRTAAVLRIINKQGSISRSDLLKRVQWLGITANGLDEILKGLAQSNAISQQQVVNTGRGRPKIVYLKGV